MTYEGESYSRFPDIPPTTLSMDQALSAMDRLHPDSFARYSWVKLRHLLSVAASGHFSPVIEDSPALPILRGRAVTVTDIGRYERPSKTPLLSNLSELGVPPASTSYGRCHIPGSPVFYGAFDEATILAEIAPERDSVVYILECVPRNGMLFRTALIGEIDHVRRYGKSSILPDSHPAVIAIKEWVGKAESEQDYVRLVTDAFFADLFSRRAVTQNDYKATSALAGLFLGLDVDHPGSCEAIYYPSIANRGGMNLVLTRRCYEEKVVPISCRAVHVSAYFGYGIYKTRVIAKSSTFGENGEIKWAGVAESA